jgi:hypothetical protein
MRGQLVRLITVSTLAIGASLTAMPAGANETVALYGCASWIPGSWANYSTAECAGGTGTYRAVAYCHTSTGAIRVRYGAWKSPVGGSYANCANGERIYDHAYQTSS